MTETCYFSARTTLGNTGCSVSLDRRLTRGAAAKPLTPQPPRRELTSEAVQIGRLGRMSERSGLTELPGPILIRERLTGISGLLIAPISTENSG